MRRMLFCVVVVSFAVSVWADFEVYFMRHGETPWNAAKVLQGSVGYTDLTPTGVAMAEESATTFARDGIRFDRVYTSPYTRARHTAEIVAKTSNLVPIPDPRIRERCCGDVEGQTYVGIADLNAKMAASRGVESMDDVLARTLAFFEDELKPLDGRVTRVLCVSHTLLLNILEKQFSEKGYERKSLLPNCCVHVLRYHKGTFSFVAHGRKFYADDAVAACVAARRTTGLPDAPHDRGGVTFDFAKISAVKFPSLYPKVGANILANPWRGIYTNSSAFVVDLPHDRGGTFRIAARTKVRPIDPEIPMRDTAIMIRLGNRANGGKGGFVETPKRGGYVWNGFLKKGNDWHVATKVFTVRPGESHAWVCLHCHSACVELKDVVLCEEVPQPGDSLAAEKTERPLTITTQFCSYTDGAFEVSQNQVGEIAFSFKRPKEEEFDFRKGVFTLTLPPGLAFVGVSFGDTNSIKTERLPDGSSRTTFRPRASFAVGLSDAWWTAQYVLVRATGRLGAAGDGRLAYAAKDGARTIAAESMRIHFSIVPTIVGAQPKEYGCGGWQLNAYAFDDAACSAELARFHQICGQTWIIPSAATDYRDLPLWRACGFRKITPQTGGWCVNGYNLSVTDVPESDRFVAAPGVDKVYKHEVCPRAVIEGTPYAKRVTLKTIADHCKGVDGLWANWEPFMYCEVGCACTRCGKAFAAFLGKDWSSISNVWPACAFPKGAWSKKGVEFRSRTHGALVKTIDRAVREVTGKDSVGFMPGIHFGQMTSSWRQHHPMPEASPEHYAADIPYINLWGPYVAWRSDHPYHKERARHVVHFAYAKDLREQLAKDYPTHCPRILAGPQGTCGDYFNQPEAFEMDFDAYFFNRFVGCCPWVFPMGADARYWRSFANASRRAAKYEEPVLKGTPSDADVTIETVPEFAGPVARFMRWLANVQKAPQIYSTSYDYRGARYVAVFNCWQGAEAFLTLKAANLSAGDYQVVSHDGIWWTKDRERPTYTAEELAKGIFVSVGACRTRVFEIVPEGDLTRTLPTSVMTDLRVRTLYAARQSALRAAAAYDKYEAADDMAGISWCD